jgi:hypothetical protein
VVEKVMVDEIGGPIMAEGALEEIYGCQPGV